MTQGSADPPEHYKDRKVPREPAPAEANRLGQVTERDRRESEP